MPLREAIRQRIPERVIRHWPTLRAIFVAYHVVAISLMAFPSPPSNMSRGAWENPTVQNEFAMWAERLHTIGIHKTPKELDSDLYALAKSYLKGREKVLAPFEPYGDYAGARQSWRMFSGPQRYPIRLEISVNVGGEWRKVYESCSDEFAWRGDLLNRYRMRRVVHSTAWDNQKHFKQFCDWIATLATHDFPEASEVMVRHLRYRTPTPEEATAGKTTLESKYVAKEVRKLRAPITGGTKPKSASKKGPLPLPTASPSSSAQ